MADKNKVTASEEVLESKPAAPIAEPKKATAEVKMEVELKYGECIIAPVNNPEAEILTTIDDWNSTYNAGKNAGRFVLKAEKKS